MSATDEAAREIELVARGYTVSTRAAALGRIGGDYVMRDSDGARVALPLSTETDRLRAVWAAFRARSSGEASGARPEPRHYAARPAGQRVGRGMEGHPLDATVFATQRRQ
jgi:hypothetical protein